jgi:hypothetical protein
MKKRKLFLQWAVMASLIVTGAIFAGQLGFFGLLEADPSRVPYIILGAFILATAWCGWLCWQLSGGRDPEEIEIGLILGHYGSSVCVSLGLIGTAIGYLITFKHGATVGDAKSAIQLAFGEGSIALINTVFGAVCGLIVEIQSKYIKYDVSKVELRRKKAGEAAQPAASAGGTDEGL